MAISVNKVINSIASSPAYNKACEKINKHAASLGTKYEKSGFRNFFEGFMEPKGANNTFYGLAGLMTFCVITPRVITALKRNPDNKEATKDEIKEILFRDVQSVLIVLFMLKSLNSLIANFAGKKSGMPMLSQPYEKLFQDSVKGVGAKFQDFIQHPIDKLKILVGNIGKLLHPVEGARAKVNNEYVADYSNFEWEQLPAFFKNIKDREGKPEKIFNKIVTGTIKKYETILKNVDDLYKASINKEGQPVEVLKKEKEIVESTIEKLKQIKDKDPEILNEIQDKTVQNAIVDFLKDSDNSLVKSGKGINAWLRSAALLMEASYLGFGIPALNQLRLEKKYLRDHKNDTFMPASKENNTNATLINKNIKSHEVKLYHNFIK